LVDPASDLTVPVDGTPPDRVCEITRRRLPKMRDIWRRRPDDNGDRNPTSGDTPGL
jgi:hypothetical protein